MDDFIRAAIEKFAREAAGMRNSYHQARAGRLLALVDDFCDHKSRTTLLIEERARGLIREHRIGIVVQLHEVAEGHQTCATAIKKIQGRLEQHALYGDLPNQGRRRNAA